MYSTLASPLFQDISSLQKETPYPLSSHSPIPAPLPPPQAQPLATTRLLCLYGFIYSSYFIEMSHTIYELLCLTFSAQHNVFKVHSYCSINHTSFIFMAE